MGALDGAGVPSLIPNPTLGEEPIPPPRVPERFPRNAPLRALNGRDVEAIIRRAIAAREPRLRRVLYRTWNAQRDALTFNDLAEALREGELTPAQLSGFRDEYIALVDEALAPEWRRSIEKGGDFMRASVSRSLGVKATFDPKAVTIARWAETRGGDMITALSERQRRATRAALRYITEVRPLNPKDGARYLRGIVGLTEGQAKAVSALAEKLARDGASDKSRSDQVAAYSARLQRIRAERIARTELALAFNRGTIEQIRQAQLRELGGAPVIKEWLTGQDERVCSHCGPLEGQLVELESTYPTASRREPYALTPPAHPGCRCTLVYQMVEG